MPSKHSPVLVRPAMAPLLTDRALEGEVEVGEALGGEPLEGDVILAALGGEAPALPLLPLMPLTLLPVLLGDALDAPFPLPPAEAPPTLPLAPLVGGAALGTRSACGCRALGAPGALDAPVDPRGTWGRTWAREWDRDTARGRSVSYLQSPATKEGSGE
jgi:hypothetical protein